MFSYRGYAAGGGDVTRHVSEHGMWGYPEFYIPVPGGYGSESHSAALSPGMRHHATAPAATLATEAG